MTHPLPAFAAAPIWQASFWISYLGWIGIEVWIVARDRRAASGAADDRGSRRFIGLAFTIGLVGLFYCGQWLWWGRIDLRAQLLMPIALALIWGGIAFRLWAVATLGRFFRTSVMVLDDHRLIGTGPYRRLRNPSYTGSVATLVGIGLAVGSWPGLAWLTACVLVGYARRIGIEDAALRSRFGAEYEDYRKDRWALIPLVW